RGAGLLTSKDKLTYPHIACKFPAEYFPIHTGVQREQEDRIRRLWDGAPGQLSRPGKGHFDVAVIELKDIGGRRLESLQVDNCTGQSATTKIGDVAPGLPRSNQIALPALRFFRLELL